jgi:hypothetical protein
MANIVTTSREKKSAKKRGEIQVAMITNYLIPNNEFQQKLNQGTMYQCQIGWPDLRLTGILPKTSASDTILCTGILHGDDVIVKVSFDPKKEKERTILDKIMKRPMKPVPDNSLSIERQIYEYLVPFMSKYTPNLVTFVGNGRCSTFVKSLDEMYENKNQDPEYIFRLAMHMRNNDISEGHDLSSALCTFAHNFKSKRTHARRLGDSREEAIHYKK